MPHSRSPPSKARRVLYTAKQKLISNKPKTFTQRTATFIEPSLNKSFSCQTRTYAVI